MSKHTPGPWAAFSDGNHTNIVAVKPSTKCVFSLPGHHKSDPDIALIAAAPELLEALQAAMPHLEAAARADNATYALARAALAKANGEGGYAKD